MAQKEITLIPLQSITVVRDGAFVNPPVGQVFAFYENEVADIQKAEKAHDKALTREPVNEAPAKKAPESDKGKVSAQSGKAAPSDGDL